MGEPVGELAVVGQQQQAGRVGVEAADRVEPRLACRPARRPPAAPPGSLAVETTPAGLFTAQTSRASAADRAAVDPHVVALPDVPRRIGDHLAADRHPPVGDDLLRLPPRSDAAVGEELREPHERRGRGGPTSLPAVADGTFAGLPHLGAAVRRPSAAARAARARPPGVGSKREGSGSWSSPERPKSRSNSSRGLEDRGAEARAARLLDQAALGQRLHRRLRGDAADAGDLRPRDRLQVGDDRQRLGLRLGQRRRPRLGQQAPRRLLAGRVAGEGEAAGDLAQDDPAPALGEVLAQQLDRLRRPGPRSPRSPRPGRRRATGCGERKSSASIVRARSLTRAAASRDLDRAERLASAPRSPRPCGRARAGRRAVTAWVSRSSPPNCSSKSKLARPRERVAQGAAAGAPARRSGGCG